MMKKIIVLTPVFLTLVLIIWTALVYKISQYGSWYVYPALASVPLILIWHMSLVVLNTPRKPFILYGITHLVILIPIWIRMPDADL